MKESQGGEGSIGKRELSHRSAVGAVERRVPIRRLLCQPEMVWLLYQCPAQSLVGATHGCEAEVDPKEIPAEGYPLTKVLLAGSRNFLEVGSECAALGLSLSTYPTSTKQYLIVLP